MTVGLIVRIDFGGTVLGDTHPDRVQGQTGGVGDSRDPTPSEGQSFTGRPTST
jgi:hypothetical protein